MFDDKGIPRHFTVITVAFLADFEPDTPCNSSREREVSIIFLSIKQRNPTVNDS